MESHQVHNQRPQARPHQSSAPLSSSVPDPNPDPSGKKKDRKTAFLVVIIILLVVAVGVLAYLLISQEQSSSISNSQTTATNQEDKKEAIDTDVEEQKDETPPVDPTVDWKTLSSETYSISFKHPGGSDWAANITDWALSSGQRATGNAKYLPCGPNCGWALSLRIITKGTSDDPGMQYGENQFQGNDYYKLISKKDVVKDDVTGVRWEYAPADDKAATIVYYYFTKGNLAYTFEVNMNGSKTDAVDITKTGEMIMDTLKFSA